MSGYERINAVLRGENPRPVPTMLHSFMPAAAEKGYTQAEYRSSPENIARSHIDFARKYGLDGVLIDIDTCLEAGAIGVPVHFPEDEPARITEPFSTNIDECLEVVEADRLEQDQRIHVLLESVQMIKDETKGDLLIRGNADQAPFSLAMLLLGISNFMMKLYDEPEKIHMLIERCFDVHLKLHRLLIEAGADITSFGDSSCGPDLVSPDTYREFSLPYHVRLAKALEKDSIKTVCHICGNLDLILPDVANAGFAAIEADYKTSIPVAAEVLKDGCTLFGPIDPSGVFFFGTPMDVVEKTKDVLRCFPDGNLVIGAGCALPPGIPEDNIKAFVNTVRCFDQERDS
jgi:uroporphyrinogen decarboxylase